MNKTIQSNSYRGYSSKLVKDLKKLFTGNTDRFLVNNLHRCLGEFEVFAENFPTAAETLAEHDRDFRALDELGQKRFRENWLREKVNKALDVYWAPLSQAATQYLTPAYAEHFKKLMEQDKPTLERYIKNLNVLSHVAPENEITINDLVLFLDELTLIRLAPYTKTALISIPFRVFEAESAFNDEKLSGIAHELGHFLYWRLSEFNQINSTHDKVLEEITKQLEGKGNEGDEREVRFIRAWFEELFADIVGAKIAGDSYIKSCESMILRNNKKISDLEYNDQAHVPDILRLLVCIYAASENKENALSLWRKFFSEKFPVEISKINIETLRENETQRGIIRSADQLSIIILDAIDLVNEELEKGNEGLFRPNFAHVSDASKLTEKAFRIETKQQEISTTSNESISTALEIFLQPQILEAGAQWHTHTWKTTSPHSHTKTESHYG